MDVTDLVSDTAVWWSCAGCAVDVELTAADVAGFLPACPDCSGPVHELWRWGCAPHDPARCRGPAPQQARADGYGVPSPRSAASPGSV